MLIETLRVSKILEKKGKTEISKLMLALASQLADLNLKLAGIKNHKVYCPTCGKQLRNGKEIEFYNQVGMCVGCDDIQATFQEEQKWEELL